ncbi:ATP-dependent Clp protease ATP-binding subunit [Candidatus Uhrbacteria bacterium]|nr:ATP-dependent Clp protease ATP-binding subunit [Candidatus Uhrbacteria bacterium]
MENFQLAAVIVVVLAIIGSFAWKKWKASSAASPSAEAFTLDMTAQAKAGKLEAIVGMDEVIERMIHVIARKSKNNPLLIGEPGVGKTAVVEGLAQRIVSGDVPASFKGKQVLALNLGELLSGTRYRGELEGRLRNFLKTLETNSRQTILFIDEIHMLEQARGSEGSLDIADMLKPALSRGDLQVIGATTWDEYQKFLKPDPAIDRRFQPVLVEEPSRENSIAILEGVKDNYEKFHHVCIPRETVEAAVDASVQFIKDRFLPDKAFDVIDEACAKVSIESTRPHAAALGLIHAASNKAKDECGLKENIVTPEDVKDVASEWRRHRLKPQG